MTKHLVRITALGSIAAAALAFATPAQACGRHHCPPGSSASSTSTSSSTSTGSTGGTQVPAPAGFALFGLAALGLAARNRFARRAR